MRTTRMLGAAIAVLAWAGLAAAQDDLSSRSLALVNAARGDEGLGALEWDDRLAKAARAHADDMADRGYYDHVSPEGGTVRDRFLDAGGGRWRLVAENLARCRGCPVPPDVARVEAFHGGWMDSPPHREAILDPGLDSFGFATAVAGDVTYGVQTFAGPGGPEGNAAAGSAIRARALADVNRARAAKGLAALAPDADLDDAAARMGGDGALDTDGDALTRALAAASADGGTVRMAAGTCGGCGAVPLEADASDFVSDWLADPSLSAALLAPALRRFGFTLTADGRGRKAAVALMGAP